MVGVFSVSMYDSSLASLISGFSIIVYPSDSLFIIYRSLTACLFKVDGTEVPRQVGGQGIYLFSQLLRKRFRCLNVLVAYQVMVHAVRDLCVHVNVIQRLRGAALLSAAYSGGCSTLSRPLLQLSMLLSE
jgi:hypothetical protein